MPETVHTVYTATETVFSFVPCKGCVLATTTLYAPGVGPGGGGWPYDGPTTTTTATGPSKTTSTICIPSHHPILPTVLPQVLERDDLEPDLKISAQPPPTAVARKTRTKGRNCPEYTFPIPTSTNSISKPVITLPGAGRTNPIEPTATYAILRGRQAPNLEVQAIVTTTVTLTSKSWSATTTSTKYTTCFYGPYQDPDPGAIPKRDVEVDNKDRCTTPPPATEPTKTTIYKTIVIPETGTLTRTTVKCTKTVLTRRPKPTFTLDVGGDLD